MSDELDGELLRRFVQGDQDAFESLFRQFQIEAACEHDSLCVLPVLLRMPSQFVLEMPAWPLARAIVFPMAVVPNLWGLWNMLYLALRSRVRLPLGLHGALLPLFLIPGGVALARVLDVFTIQLQYAVPIIPIGMGIYYLAWKFLVGFLNQEMGIA
jgi:hypothetical protein